MTRFILSLFVLFSISSCTTRKNIGNLNADLSFDIVYSDNVKSGDFFNLTVYNYSLDSIIIYNPSIKSIEKFDNNTWRKVRIQNCPCGANCSKPPKTLILLKGESYKVNWNLIESWCGEKDKQGIKASIENKSSVGLYRSKIRILIGNDQQTLYKEFNIIE